MTGDVIAVVEACYRVQQSEQEWLKGCFDAVQPFFADQIGFVGYTYDSTEGGAFRLRHLLSWGTDEFRQQAPELLASVPPVLVQSLRSHFAFLASELDTDRQIQRLAMRRGLDLPDGFTINGIDSDGTGCVLAGGVRSGRVAARRRALWSHVAAHLGAGLRLQRLLARSGPGPVDAVMHPSGKVLHAEPGAQSRQARSELVSVCRAIEHARTVSGRARPEQTLPHWRTLVLGQWTLVDQFENDGQRFLVARENAPAAMHVAELSTRERQAIAFLALGHNNKHIAYALGISASTVGVLLHRAAHKLAVKSRAELLQRARSLAAPT